MLYQKILEDSVPVGNKGLSPEATALLQAMLKKDMRQRIPPGELKSHPFFRPIDFGKLLKKELIPPLRLAIVSLSP